MSMLFINGKQIPASSGQTISVYSPVIREPTLRLK